MAAVRERASSLSNQLTFSLQVLGARLLDGTWWRAMHALRPGDSLTLPVVHFWKSLRYARGDWCAPATPRKRGTRAWAARAA
jgi:hypothetical protein